MRNKSLDILKFVSSLFVVMIHYPFPEPYGTVIKAFGRFALPVFFMTSGFFSYSISAKSCDKIRKRALHLFKIFIISFILYYISYIILNHRLYSDEWLADTGECIYYFRVLFLNHPISSYFIHLWFLTALIYCYLILWILIKINKAEYLKFFVFIIPFTILFFDVIIAKHSADNYAALWGRNFLAMGLPFFALGYLLKEKEEKLKKVKLSTLLLLSVFSILLFAAEYIFLNNSSELYLASALFAVCLFVICIKYKSTYKSRYAFLISESPLYIYIIHLMIARIIYALNSRIHIDYNLFVWLRPVLTLILSVLISFIISAAAEHNKLKKYNKKREG